MSDSTTITTRQSASMIFASGLQAATLTRWLASVPAEAVLTVTETDERDPAAPIALPSYRTRTITATWEGTL